MVVHNSMLLCGIIYLNLNFIKFEYLNSSNLIYNKAYLDDSICIC